LEIRQQNEQTIERHSIDEALYSGFDAASLEKAQTKVKSFRDWIEKNRDEFTALQILYAGTKPLRISLKYLRQLKDALASPPVAATPTQLWTAYEAVDQYKVVGAGGAHLSDLVSLVRHALLPEDALLPYADVVRARYEMWLNEQKAERFTPEQREWLDRMAEHIATSLTIEPEDFETGWFGQHG